MKWHHLEDALTFVENIFGMGWLKNWVDKIKELDPEKTTTGRYINLRDAGIPPLVLMWYKGREQLALYHLTGQFLPSPEALLLGGLVDDIKSMEHSPGLDMRLESLKDFFHYAPAAYEIHIAAGYVNQGHEISFGRDLGMFQANKGDLSIICHKPLDRGDEDSIVRELKLTPALAGNQAGTVIHYVDCEMVPGEEPGKRLRQRARSLTEKLSDGPNINVICTATFLERNSRGFCLKEISVPLLKATGNLNIFLPGKKR